LGTAGAGKTEVAVEYIYRYQSEYDLVWWIPADEEPSVRRSLVRLSHRLRISESSDRDERVAAVLQALRVGSTERWLLVFDNAAESTDISTALAGTAAGHVLLTSRDRHWVGAIDSLDVAPSRHRAGRDTLFISYSHSGEDQKLLQHVRTHLKPLERGFGVKVWLDAEIRPGEKWLEKILEALSTTRMALVLMSPDLLASEFVMSKELPLLLNAERKGEVTLLQLILRPCLLDSIEGLSQIQTVNSPEEPLYGLKPVKRDRILVELARLVENEFRR